MTMNPSPPPVMHLPPYTPAPAVKRLHSVVCFAFRPSENELKCYAIFVAAADVDEAKGDRMHKLLQVHPVEDGWESHSVEAVQVPDRIVMEAAMAMYEGDQKAIASRIAPDTLASPAPAEPSGFTLGALDPFALPPSSLTGIAEVADLPVTEDNGLTVGTVEALPAFSIENLPRLTGPRILVGSSREGKILPAEHLHAAAMEAAKSEVSQALRDSIKVIGPAE